MSRPMLKSHIHLAWELALRDLRGRYVGSSLGLVWAFLQPLLQLLLFTFVFSTVLKISLAGERGVESFPLFLFAGLLPWMGLNEMVQRSTTALVEQANLIKKMAFPPQLLIAGILISGLIHQALAAVVFLVVLAFTGHLSWAALALPLLMGLQIVLVAGFCLLGAALQVFFRDTAQLVSYGLMVLFYGTPIVYPLSLINDPTLLSVLRGNPVTALVEAFRDILLRGTLPEAGAVIQVLAWGGVALGCGIILFWKWRPEFADAL